MNIRFLLFYIMVSKIISKSLKFIKVFDVKEQPEGEGATVKRSIGTKECKDFDPFLMMDHFKVRLPSGFPDHPHRGFETVTYMFSGSIYHEDFKGHKGVIGPGDIQWMTAGRGILHSEIPGSKTEDSEGIQLWINLNKKNKMIEPKYQEFTNDTIPIVLSESGKSQIKVISGEYNGVTGPVKSITSVHYYDIKLGNKDTVKIKVNKGEVNIFIYQYEGEPILVLNNIIKKYQSALLSKISDTEEILELTIESSKENDKKSGLILLLGHPLKEPIAKYGPFVMNTSKELEETFDDYNRGKNGFEGAKEWSSKIKDKMFE